MRRRPLVYAGISWIAGSAAACLLPLPRLLAVWGGLALVFAGLAVCRQGGVRQLLLLWMMLTLGGAYWEWTDHRNMSSLSAAVGMASSAMDGLPVYAEGMIDSTVERDGDRVDFILSVNRISVSGGHNTEGSEGGSSSGGQTSEADLSRIQTEVTGKQISHKGRGEQIAVQLKLLEETEIGAAAEWKRGDRVAIKGTLALPASARNFDGFDYSEYLRYRRIHWLIKVTGTEQAVVRAPGGFGFRQLLRWSDSVRNAVGGELDALFSERDAGYLKGLIIGMQDGLDPDTYKQFSNLGLTHILAISGMHVAVYAGVLLFLLTRLRLTRETALTVTMMVLPLYVLFAGAGPSVIRAGIMSMIALYAARMGILKDGLHVLALTAWLMLLWDPYYLVNVSFQLSFLVTAGLILFVPLAAPLFGRLPNRLAGAVAVTLVAQLVSFPLTIYYFNQFALLSFAANLVLVPFITFGVLPLGTAALALARLWPFLARQLARLVVLMNDATFAAVNEIGRYAGITIWRSPSLLWIGLYYALLYGLLWTVNKRAGLRSAPVMEVDETKPLEGLVPQGGGIAGGADGLMDKERQAALGRCRAAAVSLLLGLAALLYWGYRPQTLSAGGSISFLDVGQGDSILISAPGGVHILVDGGGTLTFGEKEAWRIRRSPYEVGAKTLVPLLKKRGIHRLDAVILTHGDQDHAGGLQAVLEEIPVTSLLFNGTAVERESYSKLMRIALQRGVKLYGVHEGMTLSPANGTTLSFLWPEPMAPEADGSKVPVVEEQNDYSVVFRLEMGGRSFLFPGDMEKGAEESVVAARTAAGQQTGGPVDVLKAAHHGSKTSSSDIWLQYWKPAAAVISVGEGNTYGHPNEEVLDRYAAAGINVFRTDLQGEIQMKLESGRLLVRYRLGDG